MKVRGIRGSGQPWPNSASLIQRKSGGRMREGSFSQRSSVSFYSVSHSSHPCSLTVLYHLAVENRWRLDQYISWPFYIYWISPPVKWIWRITTQVVYGNSFFVSKGTVKGPLHRFLHIKINLLVSSIQLESSYIMSAVALEEKTTLMMSGLGHYEYVMEGLRYKVFQSLTHTVQGHMLQQLPPFCFLSLRECNTKSLEHPLKLQTEMQECALT